MLKHIIAITLLFSTIVTLATFDIKSAAWACSTPSGRWSSSTRPSSCPFATWLLIGYFASIPKELDEAALVDGASHFQMLTRIFLPVAVPGLIAATVFAFTVSWSGFLYPLAFIFSSDQQVLTAGTVTSLIKGDVYRWGGLMAGAVLACLPSVLLYVFLMDYYISGLTAGSTKG